MSRLGGLWQLMSGSVMVGWAWLLARLWGSRPPDPPEHVRVYMPPNPTRIASGMAATLRNNSRADWVDPELGLRLHAAWALVPNARVGTLGSISLWVDGRVVAWCDTVEELEQEVLRLVKAAIVQWNQAQ